MSPTRAGRVENDGQELLRSARESGGTDGDRRRCGGNEAEGVPHLQGHDVGAGRGERVVHRVARAGRAVSEIPGRRSSDRSDRAASRSRRSGRPSPHPRFPRPRAARSPRPARSLPVGAHTEKTSLFADESSVHITRRLPRESAAPPAPVETPGFAERFTGAPNVFPPSKECT